LKEGETEMEEDRRVRRNLLKTTGKKEKKKQLTSVRFGTQIADMEQRLRAQNFQKIAQKKKTHFKKPK
jgi:hypothetical protein